MRIINEFHVAKEKDGCLFTYDVALIDLNYYYIVLKAEEQAKCCGGNVRNSKTYSYTFLGDAQKKFKELIDGRIVV